MSYKKEKKMMIEGFLWGGFLWENGAVYSTPTGIEG